MNNQKLFFALLGLDIILVLGIFGWIAPSQQNNFSHSFDGESALNDVKALVNLGPRIPGSQAHAKAIEYIQFELKKLGWKTEIFKQKINGHTAINILATRNLLNPVILLGAHYDSRIFADNDPIIFNRRFGVPGANDGASGNAVLIELARSLPKESVPIALLFIDIEDNGRIPGWDWIQGSRAFANQMTIKPKAVVIVDMIGDADLNIFMEKYSDANLTNQIWKTAKDLGHDDVFIPKYKYSVLDDHIPFIEKGFNAVDIIDLDYPYWHTSQDLPDKVSAPSLKKVGDTLLLWIRNFGPCLQNNNCSSP